ncbi:GreA/GreB family elongation factor [Sphingobacterium hungaricum]
MDSIKEKLKQICLDLTEKRIQEIEVGIASAQEAIFSDTKNSAGDKYETSREMLQQDLTRFENQLSLAKEDYAVLSNLESSPNKLIGLGSLIETDQGFFYIAVGIGKVMLDDATYYAISPQSPLAKEFLGKKKGNKVNFNQKEFSVKEIL